MSDAETHAERIDAALVKAVWNAHIGPTVHETMPRKTAGVFQI